MNRNTKSDKNQVHCRVNIEDINTTNDHHQIWNFNYLSDERFIHTKCHTGHKQPGIKIEDILKSCVKVVKSKRIRTRSTLMYTYGK